VSEGRKGKREKEGASPRLATCMHAPAQHCFALADACFSCLACSAWLAAANTYLFYNDIPGLTGEWQAGQRRYGVLLIQQVVWAYASRNGG
jgi:hypothetical protein